MNLFTDSSLAFLQNTGPGALILILVVVVLLFGSKKLPELFGSLGKSVTAFKKGKEEGIRELEDLKTEADETSEVAAEEKTETNV